MHRVTMRKVWALICCMGNCSQIQYCVWNLVVVGASGKVCLVDSIMPMKSLLAV